MRRRLFKTALAIALFLTALIGIGAALVQRSDYAHFVEQHLRAETEARGVRLGLRQFDIFFLGAAASEVDLFFVRALTSLQLQRFRAEVSVITPQIDITASVYDGPLRASARLSGWLHKDAALNAELDRASIAKHPQLAALGITQGSLNATLAEARLVDGRLESGSFNLVLTDVDKPDRLTIRSEQFGLPRGFVASLPPITRLNLTAAGGILSEDVRIERFSLDSSLGTVTGRGIMPRHGRGELSFDGIVTLTPVGRAELGPFVTLLSQGAVPPETEKIRIVVRGSSASMPTIKFSRAG